MDAAETEALYDFYKFKSGIYSNIKPGEQNSMALNYMKLAEAVKFPWVEKLKEEEKPKATKLEHLPEKERQEAERLIALYRKYDAEKKAKKEADKK